MKLEIWKDERKIATTTEYSQHRFIDCIDGEFKPHLWPGLKKLFVFHFKRLSLEPPVLFEHLGGMGLMAFLDHSDFHVKLQPADGRHSIYEDLRYVHGRSEVMKGTPSVTAVVLAQIEKDEQYNELQFKTQLPDIYREFLARKDTSTEQIEAT